jgi:hypothetical protein
VTALVGARGYGATYLRHLRGLHAAGRIRLVAVCDRAPLGKVLPGVDG